LEVMDYLGKLIRTMYPNHEVVCLAKATCLHPGWSEYLEG